MNSQKTSIEFETIYEDHRPSKIHCIVQFCIYHINEINNINQRVCYENFEKCYSSKFVQGSIKNVQITSKFQNNDECHLINVLPRHTTGSTVL